MNTILIVRKDKLEQTRLLQQPDAPLSAGQVRVRVDRFALTANNITYGAFGDAMQYWAFWPVEESGWGVIPVWGFGQVVQSLHPGVAVGERLYGYWPMADQAVLTPARLNAAGFTDAAPHRAGLHAVYNQLLRCATDPFYTSESEDAQALLRPLYITSWLIDDFLADNGCFGARAVLLSSASSKTAWGTAFELRRREGIEVIGLTSDANRAYCESLGVYSRVLGYDELDRLDAALPLVYVDFAGNAALRRRIHERFTALAYDCSVGGTHVDQLGGGRDLPGPRPVLFFAPAQIKKRHGDWGAAELGERLVRAWHAFAAAATRSTPPWLNVQHHRGPQAVQAAYAQVLTGRSDPRVGHMLSLHG